MSDQTSRGFKCAPVQLINRLTKCTLSGTLSYVAEGLSTDVSDDRQRSASNWPIAAAMLPYSAHTRDGVPIEQAGPDLWFATLAEVAHEGFDAVDFTDSWLRVAELSESGLTDLTGVCEGLSLAPVAVSVIRRSVIDPETGDENLAYSHRAIDAAARLGCEVVSVGLHRPLNEAQRNAPWFWTVQGPKDDRSDESWQLAVKRLQELGDHAADAGLKLSLEMYEDTLLGDAASAVQLVLDIDREAVGLNPDLGNLYRLHRPIQPFLDDVAMCAPHTNYWHVKSYSRFEDTTTGLVMTAPAAMETGSMNYREAIRIALLAGFDGPFCVEHYGGDGLAVSARNRDYIRGLLEFDLGPHWRSEVR